MGLALAVVGLGCGPSFQAVYECDVHFEHCYALDQAVASPDSKKACWREWLHGYTYGQSRDRVEYAATRFSELSLDPTLPMEEARDARSHRPGRAVAGPVPTNAFAPPPNVIEGHAAVTETPSPAARAQAEHAATGQAPGAGCADTCAQHWHGCRAGCKDGACDECDRTYRTCMPPCFHDEPEARHPVAH
jgi:hypothetical protein